MISELVDEMNKTPWDNQQQTYLIKSEDESFLTFSPQNQSGNKHSEFGATLDDLPIKFNVFSHSYILRNDLNWTDAVIWHTYMYYNHINTNHQCNQQKQKNAKIIGQNE